MIDDRLFKRILARLSILFRYICKDRGSNFIKKCKGMWSGLQGAIAKFVLRESWSERIQRKEKQQRKRRNNVLIHSISPLSVGSSSLFNPSIPRLIREPCSHHLFRSRNGPRPFAFVCSKPHLGLGHPSRSSVCRHISGRKASEGTQSRTSHCYFALCRDFAPQDRFKYIYPFAFQPSYVLCITTHIPPPLGPSTRPHLDGPDVARPHISSNASASSGRSPPGTSGPLYRVLYRVRSARKSSSHLTTHAQRTRYDAIVRNSEFRKPILLLPHPSAPHFFIRLYQLHVAPPSTHLHPASDIA